MDAPQRYARLVGARGAALALGLRDAASFGERDPILYTPFLDPMLVGPQLLAARIRPIEPRLPALRRIAAERPLELHRAASCCIVLHSPTH